MKLVSDYDLRSLQHERRMLELYRRGSASDAALLQPLANACWRASAFEWRLYEDETSTRNLWEEGARVLGDGFVRRRPGFERSPEQLLLAIHMSIAARAFKLMEMLTHITSSISSSRLNQKARFQGLLLEGYLGLARSVFENRKDQSLSAQRLLEEASVELDQDAWKQRFVSSREAAWKAGEHKLLCEFLRVIAELVLSKESRSRVDRSASFPTVDLSMESKFAALMDQALADLEEFVEGETDHRPKLYFWLPGIAMSVLAEAAGLSLDWLLKRQQEEKERYSRLPLKLIAA